MSDTPIPRRQPLIISAMVSDGHGGAKFDMFVQTPSGFVRERLKPEGETLQKNPAARDPLPWHDVYEALAPEDKKRYQRHSPSLF